MFTPLEDISDRQARLIAAAVPINSSERLGKRTRCLFDLRQHRPAEGCRPGRWSATFQAKPRSFRESFYVSLQPRRTMTPRNR